MTQSPSPSFRGERWFLSNFYPAPVFGYPTVEHAFVASKTLDPAWRAKVKACASPGQAKRLGRTIPLRPDWDLRKLEIMRALLVEKFRDPELRAKLLATTGALQELNTWHDNYWGTCTCDRCQNMGQNHLGRLLTQIRTELREP